MKRKLNKLLCLSVILLLFSASAHSQTLPTDKGKIRIKVHTSYDGDALGLTINTDPSSYESIWLDMDGNGVYDASVDMGPDKIVEGGESVFILPPQIEKDLYLYGSITSLKVDGKNKISIKEIDAHESPDLQFLTLSETATPRISLLNLMGLPLLQEVEMAEVNAYSEAVIDFSKCRNLRSINFTKPKDAYGGNVRFKSWKLDDLPSLEYLNARCVNVAEGDINLAASEKLITLALGSIEGDIQLPKLDNIVNFSLAAPKMQTPLDLSKFGQSVRSIFFNGVSSNKLTLKALPNLENFTLLEENASQNIDINITACPKLRSIDYTNQSSDGNINSISVTQCDKLESIRFEIYKNEQATSVTNSITIEPTANLRDLELMQIRYGNQPYLLDLTKCPNLQILLLTGKKNHVDVRLPDALPSLRCIAIDKINTTEPITIKDALLNSTGVGESNYIDGDRLASITIENVQTSRGERLDVNVKELGSVTIKNCAASFVIDGFEKLKTVQIENVREIAKRNDSGLSLKLLNLATNSIDLSTTEFTRKLTIENCPELSSLKLCKNVDYEEIKLKNLPKLGAIDFSHILNARDVTINNCNQKTIDLSGLRSQAKNFDLANNGMTSLKLAKGIDISKLINLAKNNLNNETLFKAFKDINSFTSLTIRHKDSEADEDNQVCAGLIDYLKTEKHGKYFNVIDADNNNEAFSPTDQSHLVYYDVPSGIAEPKVEFLKSGDAITTVANPKLNETDGVWSATAKVNEPFDFSTKMGDENIKLTAVWSDAFSHIELVNYADVGNEDITNLKVLQNKPFTLPTPQYKYGEFIGWSPDGSETNLAENPFTPTQSSYRLQAVWRYENAKITLEFEGGLVPSTSVDVRKGENIAESVNKPTLLPEWVASFTLSNATNPSEPVPEIATEDLSLNVKLNPLSVLLKISANDVSNKVKTNREHTINTTADKPLLREYLYQAGVPKEAKITCYIMNRFNSTPEKIKQLGTPIMAYMTNLGIIANPTELWIDCSYALPIEIQFNTDGGTDIPPAHYYADEKIVLPYQPTKEGHMFDGWYIDPKCTLLFNTDEPAGRSLTLYAKWKAITPSAKYKVKYITRSTEKIADAEVDDGGLAEAKTLQPQTAPKKKFIGWTVDPQGSITYDFTTPVKHDLTLYANWKNVYTVTLHCKSWNPTKKEVEVTSGEKLKEEKVDDLTDQIFTHWEGNTNIVAFDFNTPIEEDLDLYAKFKNKPQADDPAHIGVLVDNNRIATLNGTVGKEIGQLPEKLGDKHKKLISWHLYRRDGVEVTPTTKIELAWFNIYAKYTLVSFIHFDSQGGSPVESIEFDYNTIPTAPTNPTKDGFNFAGWFFDAECQLPYNFDVEFKDLTATLYANWVDQSVVPPAVEKCTVHIDEMNGTSQKVIEVEKNKVLPKIIPPVFAGHIFKGWFTDKDYTKPFDVEHTKITEKELYLFAKWEVDNTPQTPVPVKINLVAEHGKVEVINVTQNGSKVDNGGSANQKEQLKATATADAGYKFVHFQIGTVKSTENPFTFNIPEVTTLKLVAVFEKIGGQDDTSEDETAVESALLSGVRAFPNPFADQVIVEGLSNCTHYALFNLLGHQIKSGAIAAEQIQINTMGLLQGVYILRLTAVDGSSKSILLQKQ